MTNVWCQLQVQPHTLRVFVQDLKYVIYQDFQQINQIKYYKNSQPAKMSIMCMCKSLLVLTSNSIILLQNYLILHSTIQHISFLSGCWMMLKSPKHWSSHTTYTYFMDHRTVPLSNWHNNKLQGSLSKNSSSDAAKPNLITTMSLMYTASCITFSISLSPRGSRCFTPTRALVLTES